MCGLMVALLLVTAAAAEAEDHFLPAEKVAEVNGAVITREELTRETGRLMRRDGEPARKEPEKTLNRKALDNLVTRELLWQESRRQGITVPGDVVTREFEGLRGSLQSTIELEKTLGDMDLAEDTVLKEIERGMVVRRLIEHRLSGKIEPAEQEIREYYDRHPDIFRVPEQVRISHILVRIQPRWQAEKKEAARQRTIAIRERLRKGGDFEALALETSGCPSGKKGGSLGWFSRGSLTKPLEDAVFSLPEGSMSDIIEDRFGFHLIKVTGRRPARQVSYAEGRGKIVDYLRQERVRREADSLAHELRSRAKVKVFLAETE